VLRASRVPRGRCAEVRLADVELDDAVPLRLEDRSVLAELHGQKRRDRMGPIGQPDSSLQAVSLRDILR
jgi:hypothetical protein